MPGKERNGGERVSWCKSKKTRDKIRVRGGGSEGSEDAGTPKGHGADNAREMKDVQ